MSTRVHQAAVVLTWAAAWVLPWQGALAAWPGLCSALGLLLFCVPGLALSLLLDDHEPRAHVTRLPDALLLSIAITGALGFAGSVAGASPRVVEIGLWLVGARALAVLAAHGLPSRTVGDGLRGALAAIALLCTALITARLCFSPVMGADDMTYVARMTWFQQTPALSFRGIVFGGAQLIAPRDWLSFWPLGEAIVGRLAGVHGLQLTTLYLGPLLGLLTVLAVFALARSLGMSARAAVVATTLQIALLLFLHGSNEPGRHFFQRLTEDKFLALCVLGPVALRLATRVFAGEGGRLLTALAVGWAGIALVHPTALGILFLILGAYAALELLAARNARALLVLAVVLPITGLAASVRFVPTDAPTQAYFDVESATQANAMTGARQRRVDVVPGTGFYGISTRAAQPRARAFGGIVLALALLRVRRDRVARYVAAGLGVAALAIVPQTGWLLGKLLTPFHLWRILSAVPYGIAAAFFLRTVAARLVATDGHVAQLTRRASAVAPLLAVIVLTASAAYAAANWRTFRIASLRVPTGWQERLDSRVKFDRSRPRFPFADLLAVARTLDQAIDGQAVVLGEPEINSLIPSLSAKAVLVAFRSPSQTSLHSGKPIEDARRTWRIYQQLVAGDLSADAAVRFLRKRDVRFVVTATDAPWLAAIGSDVLPRRTLLTAGDLRVVELVPQSDG
jgi:hypothetical protein